MFGIGGRRGVAARALKDRIVGRVGVAGGAHAVGVAVIEREEGVIAGRQRGRNPGGRGVAGGAGRGPARRHVIRIRRSREVGLMAGVAGGRRSREHIVDVALDAVDTVLCAPVSGKGVLL